jgi:hypothetical protein
MAIKVILSAASQLRHEGSDWRSGELIAVAANNLARFPNLMAVAG